MADIKRLYPEPKTALINWMEQNFHEIEGYVVTFKMSDNTTMTVYDAESFLEAVGLVGISNDTILTLGRNDEFIPRSKRDS